MPSSAVIRQYGFTGQLHEPPDHRAAADAVLDAVFPSARDRLIFPELLDEGLAPTRSRRSSSTAPSARHYVDIGEVLDVKIAALKQHKSQMGTWDPTTR
jgi:LmbE family N-acetylglucosaminyl deacetylase